MDWVKEKNDQTKKNGDGVNGDPQAAKIKSRPSKSSSTKNIPTVTATAWLDELCRENVAYLQKTLPVRRVKSHPTKRQTSSIGRMAAALDWGTGSIDYEIEEGSDVLERLIQAYTSHPWLKLDPADSSTVAAKEHRLKTCENVARWIVRILPVHGTDPFVGLVGAAWVHGLHELGSDLPPNLWLEVLQSILTQVERAWSEPPPKPLLPWLIWSCELPLALATQLSQLGGKDRMVIESMDRLTSLLDESNDDPAAWIHMGGRSLRALLACVVRCRWAADALQARDWSKPRKKAIAKLASIGLSLTHADGRPLLVDASEGADDRELWSALTKLCSPNKRLESLIEVVIPDRTVKKSKRSNRESTKSKDSTKATDWVRLPDRGRYFASAELATIRRDWQHQGFRIAVDFARDPMWIDCVGGDGQRLLSGQWDLVICKDGKQLETDVGWSEVCWFSDDDVDYLEIESAVEGRCRIQRQLMLTRREGLMFFSDTLLADESGRWSLNSTWELGPQIEFRAAGKTNEAELLDQASDGQRCGLLLPLALPEWRRQPSQGKLYSDAGILVLRHAVDGNRLYSPLVLATKKLARQPVFTWRHLTVAQDLAIQPAEVAQAYRVQIGKEQVMFYRSLAKIVRRTAMGLHLNSEFYAGRFDSDDANFEPIVEINADDAL